MTVAELIKELKKHDPNAVVVYKSWAHDYFVKHKDKFSVSFWCELDFICKPILEMNK